MEKKLTAPIARAAGTIWLRRSVFCISSAPSVPTSREYIRNSTSPLNMKQPTIQNAQFITSAIFRPIKSPASMAKSPRGISVKFCMFAIARRRITMPV